MYVAHDQRYVTHHLSTMCQRLRAQRHWRSGPEIWKCLVGSCKNWTRDMAIVTQKHRKRPTKQLKRIRDAVQAGKLPKARWLSQEFLRSHNAKRLAVRLAFRRMRIGSRPDKSELDPIAKGLDAWRGSEETVPVDIRRKHNDPHDFRRTMNFGIQNRALQYLVLLPLRELANLHPSQYGQRGTHAAIQAVAKALTQGHTWAIEHDVEDCFASFDGKRALELIPVPKKVGESILISEHLSLTSGPTLVYSFGCEGDAEWWPNLHSDELAKARRGIPQGSATSSLVAEMLLAKAIHAIPPIGVVVAYADNILLIAKTKEDVVSMCYALRCALKAHPAGPLQPKRRYFDSGQPIEFLGHKLTLKTGGKVRIEPSDHNLQKFVSQVTADLHKLQKLEPSKRAARIQKVRLRIVSWTANFALCDDMKKFKASWLAKLKWCSEH
jgi:hypothetical protein